jgi:hypothetical protein
MNLFISSLKAIVQSPVIYVVSLLLQALVIWFGWVPREWTLRGGLWGQFLLEIIVVLISIGAIIQTWLSRLPKLAKFGLTLLQGPGLGLLGFIMVRMMPIVLFFGLGVCRITSDSPSGQHSITIEDACFMGCTHSVLVNSWMLEREIGEVTLSQGRFCNSDPVFTWNQAETEVKWRVRNESGLIRVPSTSRS